jgi:hypothetical protein
MMKKDIADKGITLFDDDGKVLPVVGEILEMIKHFGMTLATGHLSTKEIFALLALAEEKGVERILITHPLSRWVGPTISISDQKKMARPGIYFEHCFTGCMPHSDRMDPREIVDAVRAVGAENCILSTDFGQITNPPPVEGMRMYIEMMRMLGIEESEIITMVRRNPAKALGLPTHV